MSRSLLGVSLLICALAAPRADAASYLVGAQLYSCSADGTNGGPGAFGAVYQYSTNPATFHEPLGVSGAGGSIPFELSEGLNTFQFGTGGIDPGDYACMNLYFDDAAVALSVGFDPGIPVPGDLTVIAPVAGIGFAFPAPGIIVQSFNSNGAAVIAAPSPGATSVASGEGGRVTITSFVVDANIDGSFVIRVPESGATLAALAAIASLSLAVRRA